MHAHIAAGLNMKKSLLLIPILHLLLYTTIGLNIFVFRQITVFIYLTFIPGLVLLKILRPKEISVVDTILLSVGLSIALLMFFGLLINELYPVMGVSSPLSTIPLIITLSFLTLALFFAGYRQDLSENLSSWRSDLINLKDIIKSTILFLPVLLGVIGSLYVSVPLLLLMIIAVTALYALSSFSHGFIPSELYPLAIFAISLALITQVLLTSKYIMGTPDAHLEYYVFKLTAINGYWRLLPTGITPMTTVNYDSMLSITILPTIYSALMNVNGEIVFKALYSFIFSLVPVTLFQIYKGQIGKSASILSTFFLISGSLVFYAFSPLSLNRQIVGEFFLVLSILIWLDKGISIGKRRLLLIAFGAALVVSHYSLTYLYLVFVLSIYAISRIRGYLDKTLNEITTLFLFVIAISWYYYCVSPLTSIERFFYTVYSRFFTDISSSAARLGVLSGPHPSFESTVNSVGRINWVFLYAAHFFIAIGILRLLLNSKKLTLDPKYRILSILSALTLFLALVIPNFAPSLNFSRYYAITILFLAPCFVLGGETLVGISESILKRATKQRLMINTNRISTILLCTVLVGYFLSQSGFVNLVAGARPLSFSLEFNRTRTSSDPLLETSFHADYISEQEVFSAVWLSKNFNVQSAIYADQLSTFNVLTSYGLIPRGQILSLTNKTTLERSAFVYLGELNILDGIITTRAESFNTSEILPLISENNLIYSNGNSEIWRVCSPSPVDG